MFFFVIALEIVSITSEGNDQKCVLQLHSKEDKYFIINYTGHGVTTQEILSPMVITTIIKSTQTSTSSSSSISSDHMINEQLSNTSTIYDNLHTALLHISKLYGEWYFEQLMNKLSNLPDNIHDNDNNDGAVENMDTQQWNNYIDHYHQQHIDNNNNNDTEDNNIEWDERLIYAALQQKQKQQSQSSNVHKE